MNRTLAPEFKQADKIDLVIPQKIVLDNDISLYWLKDVKDDSVRLDIEWFAGTKYQTKKLVAGFTNKLLLSGNEKKSAREIAAEIDFYGGFVQDECDKDHSGVTLYGLKENFKNIFSVFNEAMLTCTFPEKDFEDERNITLSKFKIDSEKVKYLCQRTFNAALFGENTPYGQMA
ncbi:MAG: insulinase family protein, partial [Crocinitomicaceae bacterium]|nr:insulinase family protein [Crocinitomicaceae bacterium]